MSVYFTLQESEEAYLSCSVFLIISPLLSHTLLHPCPQSAAAQSTPITSEDPCSIMMVQLKVPDTNTPTSPNTRQQRPSNHNPPSAEYSLFELETFFTRWAPDGDSVTARSGPSCSSAMSDSADSDQDRVMIVESPQHVLQPALGSASSAVRMSGGQVLSSGAHIQESLSQGREATTSPPHRLWLLKSWEMMA